MNAPAYDYDAQEWVDDARLRDAQLEDELELLDGVDGQEYADFLAVDLDSYLARLKGLLGARS